MRTPISSVARWLPTAVVVAMLSAGGCGRTDALWWTDIYASDSGTDDHGDGDGDGDDTSGTSTTDSTSDSDTATGPTSTTDSTDTDTTTTDTDTTTTDTDTTTTDTDTTTTDTDTTTTDTDSTTTGCDDIPVGLTSAPPQVLFLLDQGSHMSLGFAGMTRWEAIGQALFGMQAGVVWSWEDSRELGFLSYTSNNGDQGGQCPITEIVGMGLQNGAAMQMAFAGLNPFDDNPTPDAIAEAVPLFGGQPGHLILLTGRNPDRCSNPTNNGPAAAATVVAAQAAFASGVSTRVVQVGDINAGFAQQLANAGVGFAPQGLDTAPFWTPADVDALTVALDEILTSLANCELTLDQLLPPGAEQACTLALDGMPIALDDPDGWSLPAPDHALLAGAACQSLAQGAMPSLICSCEALMP